MGRKKGVLIKKRVLLRAGAVMTMRTLESLMEQTDWSTNTVTYRRRGERSNIVFNRNSNYAFLRLSVDAKCCRQWYLLFLSFLPSVCFFPVFRSFFSPFISFHPPVSFFTSFSLLLFFLQFVSCLPTISFLPSYSYSSLIHFAKEANDVRNR